TRAYAPSEQINPYDGQNGVSVVTGKVVERLLLNSNRNSKRIGNGNFADSVIHRSLEALYPGDGDFVTDIVVQVQAFASRPFSRRMNCPMRSRRTPVNPVGRAECLRDGKVRVLYAPAAHVLAQPGHCPARPEFALKTDIHCGGEVLANQRAEENIAALVAGEKGRFAPGTANLK